MPHSSEVQARAEQLMERIQAIIRRYGIREFDVPSGAAAAAYCDIRRETAEALAAERQQQRAETLREVQHLVSRLRLDDSVTDTFVGGIATALMAITAALDTAVPGAREVNDG